MKKIFALALAAVMTAGMTTVAFAATKSDEVFVGLANDGNTAWDKVYLINNDGEADEVLTSIKMLEGGDEIAIPILYFIDENKDGEYSTGEFHWYTNGADYDKSVNVYADWKVGDADTELRYVKYTDDNFTGGKNLRVYSVVVTIPENNSNKVVDLSGEISVGRTRTLAKNAAHSVAVELSYAPAGVSVEKDFNGGEVDGIVAFAADCGEIDIEFGDQAMFTVDATGQSKLNLAWNTEFDSEFADKYDYANIDFIKFEGEPSFNKTGELFIYADEDKFIYEVTADGAKAVKAEWNEDYEAYRIKTRKLTAYAISDVELDEKTVTEDKDDSSKTDDGVKENPDTGR